MPGQSGGDAWKESFLLLCLLCELRLLVLDDEPVNKNQRKKLGINSSSQPSDGGVLGHCSNSFRKEWSHTGGSRIGADVVRNDQTVTLIFDDLGPP